MAPTPVTLPEICILLTCADCPDLPLYRNFVNRHRKMQRLRTFKIMTRINYLLLLTSFIIAILHSGPIRFAVSLPYPHPRHHVDRELRIQYLIASQVCIQDFYKSQSESKHTILCWKAIGQTTSPLYFLLGYYSITETICISSKLSFNRLQ